MLFFFFLLNWCWVWNPGPRALHAKQTLFQLRYMPIHTFLFFIKSAIKWPFVEKKKDIQSLLVLFFCIFTDVVPSKQPLRDECGAWLCEKEILYIPLYCIASHPPASQQGQYCNSRLHWANLLPTRWTTILGFILFAIKDWKFPSNLP